jgi:hypothetical protein
MNLIVCFLVFLISIIRLIKNKNENHKNLFITCLNIGIVYLLVSVFSFLWLFEIFFYNSYDFLIIFTIAIIIQSLSLLRLYYLMYSDKKLFYLLFFYLITLFGIFSLNLFVYLLLISSFLLILILFIKFNPIKKWFIKATIFGIIYCLISLFVVILILFNFGEIYIFSLFTNLLFLIFFYFNLKTLDIFNPRQKQDKFIKNMPLLYLYLRYFIFIITITNFIFIGTISLHEFGHFAAANFYECESSKIIYENYLPYTEALCNDTNNQLIFTLSGFFLPLLIAVFLFIIGGIFIRDISLLIIGFNLIVSFKDLKNIGLTDNIIMVIILAGVLSIVLGIVLLAKSRVNLHDFF